MEQGCESSELFVFARGSGAWLGVWGLGSHVALLCILLGLSLSVLCIFERRGGGGGRKKDCAFKDMKDWPGSLAWV